jgi:predicted transcriptional regulator YdeE
MLEIQKLEFHAKTIKGLKTRTKNSDERNSTTQKIAPLWKQFYSEVLPKLKKGDAVYGVYHNYEYDEHGEYDVLIGSEELVLSKALHTVSLEGGRYLMFPVRGDLPQAIEETWKEIWHYFGDESVDERRNFTTDFELYKSENEVEIYIGVNYF